LESLNGRDYFGNLGMDGRIILKWMLWKYDWRMWNHPATDGNRWLTLVSTVITIRVP
jgi:hypothetical protein